MLQKFGLSFSEGCQKYHDTKVMAMDRMASIKASAITLEFMDFL